MGRNDDDDSVAKMKAAEEALESKHEVRTTGKFVLIFAKFQALRWCELFCLASESVGHHI